MPTLADVMTDDVLYLTPDDSVTNAAREMKKLNVGIIPVCDDDERLLGVVTDRDIVLRVVAEGRKADEVQLSEIATQDPIAGQPDWDVSEATDLMSRNQIRRLPVIAGGKLVGIASIGDLAVKADQRGAGAALEEISKPAMPRRGALEGEEHIA